MITLDYRLASDEIAKLEKVTWDTVTASDLDYYLFRGDIFLRVDGKTLDAVWGWVPIIEFATQLFLISSKIRDEELLLLEFTESEDTIGFFRTGGNVSIRPSYISLEAVATLTDLENISKNFLDRILSDVSNQYPKLLKNASFLERKSLLTGI